MRFSATLKVLFSGLGHGEPKLFAQQILIVVSGYAFCEGHIYINL